MNIQRNLRVGKVAVFVEIHWKARNVETDGFGVVAIDVMMTHIQQVKVL